MSKEAMKLALEALEHVLCDPEGNVCWQGSYADRDIIGDALQTFREALAEQPAQQEPVATDWERIARVQNAKLMAVCDEPEGFEKLCEVMDRYERTSPPAQQEPVAAECKFDREEKWVRCEIAHHNLVQSEPEKWPGYQTRLLYTSPQPAQPTWVGLTHEEVEEVWEQVESSDFLDCVHPFARAIEAKLKEKNT